MAYNAATVNYREATKHYYGDDDFDSWMLLNHVRYFMFRAREKELRKYGISPEQSLVLHAVQALGRKAIIAEIARFIVLDKRSISSIVDRMEEKGFVQKVMDLERKNLVRVILTEKGQSVYGSTTKRESLHRIMSALSKEKSKQLKELLLELHASGRKELGLDGDVIQDEDQQAI